MEKKQILSICTLSTLILMGLSVSAGDVQAYKTELHPTLIDFALDVLDDDNQTYLVDYLVVSGSLTRIKNAQSDCDRLDLALNHYYNPVTEAGLGGATPATVIAKTFFDKAVDTYEGGDPSTAWYYFGWSLHVVQDLMVPFHSNLDPLNGHSEYEQYAYDYRYYFPLPSNGTYRIAYNATTWAVYAANASYSHYDEVSGDNATNANFDTLLETLFPQTVGLTAGYIKFFADTIGIGDFNLFTLHRGINWVRVGWDVVLDEDFYAYEVYISTDRDELLDDEPYAISEDRGNTEIVLTGLTLAVDYYVRVKALTANGTQQSNVIEVSPKLPLIFLAIPAGTALVAVVILLSQNHRSKRRVRS